jgi:hypothetical protein
VLRHLRVYNPTWTHRKKRKSNIEVRIGCYFTACKRKYRSTRPLDRYITYEWWVRKGCGDASRRAEIWNRPTCGTTLFCGEPSALSFYRSSSRCESATKKRGKKRKKGISRYTYS